MGALLPQVRIELVVLLGELCIRLVLLMCQLGLIETALLFKEADLLRELLVDGIEVGELLVDGIDLSGECLNCEEMAVALLFEWAD